MADKVVDLFLDNVDLIPYCFKYRYGIDPQFSFTMREAFGCKGSYNTEFYLINEQIICAILKIMKEEAPNYSFILKRIGTRYAVYCNKFYVKEFNYDLINHKMVGMDIDGSKVYVDSISSDDIEI